MYTTESQKEEFLKEYFRSRVISTTMVNAVMNRALESEKIFKKPFYSFTRDEIMQMYTEAKAKSSRTLQNWNLTLKHAARWFLDKQGLSTDNEYETITKEDADKCIDVDAVQKMLISKEQLETIQDDLLNYTDKAILSLLFLGVGGDMLKEITFLTSDQLSSQDNKLYFRNGKIVILSDRDYDIIKNAFEEDALVSYSANSTIINVSTGSIYKIRSNTLTGNDNPDNDEDCLRRMRWLHRRVTIMSDYLDIKMTPKSINASGFWYMAHEKMKTNGIDDFREYINTDSGRRLAWRYGFKGDYYTVTLLDKFRRYL
jgi:hypothetical protein